ncbi:MAG: phospholipid-binding domain-containing protein [Alphaproteobacteria bacterium]|nr:MAG: phospholipid-binding domain-containing protein [Alphaproteobacteria bacterium]
MKHYVILSLAASGLFLSSCTAVGVAVGVGIGTAVVQEGGISRAASDLRIQTEINDLWFRYNMSMFRKLDLTINQGRILITGVVQDPAHRVEAVRMAWQPKGVVHVINEIKVAKSEGLVGYAKDAWISTRLRAALIMAGEVESINYSIDTVQGSVYLMGFAQNQAELNQVIETARTIENVKQVVSYVKLVGTPELAPVAHGQMDASTQMTPAAAPNAAATGEPVQWNQNSVYN